MNARSDRVVRLGQITGVHGVRGWVKIQSYTEPPTNILGYKRWLLEQNGSRRAVEVERTGQSGRRLLAKLAGCDDRDQAAGLTGATVAVARTEMPVLESGEYYWADLEGLQVLHVDGRGLGKVARMLATGANDVIVLDGEAERMIPFVLGSTVTRVDLDAGEIVVDWDPSYWD